MPSSRPLQRGSTSQMADVHRMMRLLQGSAANPCSGGRLFFVGAVLALLSPALLANIGWADQAVLIEGYVFDSESGLPIRNVNVQPADPAAGASTDEKGRFVLHLSRGVYRLSFTHVGYLKAHHDLTVSGAKHPVIYMEISRLSLELDPIDIVARRAETRFDELQEATRVLSGDELRKKYSMTLAETMKNELGVAIRSMGPAPARPVIRGLSGDRVQINVDGIESQDLSSTSADHAVTVETFNAERLEIIRGPRTLLHTATAGGGVINVVKHKIPETRPKRFSGASAPMGKRSTGDISRLPPSPHPLGRSRYMPNPPTGIPGTFRPRSAGLPIRPSTPIPIHSDCPMRATGVISALLSINSIRNTAFRADSSARIPMARTWISYVGFSTGRRSIGSAGGRQTGLRRASPGPITTTSSTSPAAASDPSSSFMTIVANSKST